MLKCVFHHLQGGKKEKQSQTESRRGGREEAGGGVLPEGGCWNIEHAVLI